MRIVVVIALLLSSEVVGAQTYFKCVDGNGHVTFSQRACGDSAEELEAKTNSSGLSVAPSGDFSKMRDGNAIRSMQRRIDRLEDEAEALTDRRDQELAVLKDRKRYALNNLAGATWEQSLSTEMQAVSENYNSQIDAKRDEIQRLREDIARLNYTN